MTTPEHHQDGAHTRAPQPPTELPETAPTEDEWRAGETEADREARLKAEPVSEPGLAEKWAERQDA